MASQDEDHRITCYPNGDLYYRDQLLPPQFPPVPPTATPPPPTHQGPPQLPPQPVTQQWPQPDQIPTALPPQPALPVRPPPPPHQAPDFSMQQLALLPHPEQPPRQPQFNDFHGQHSHQMTPLQLPNQLPNQSSGPSQIPPAIPPLTHQHQLQSQAQGQPPVPSYYPQQSQQITPPPRPPSNPGARPPQAPNPAQAKTNQFATTGLLTPDIPLKFKPDANFLDANLPTDQMNLRQGEQSYFLRRNVKPSAWSNKIGIANVPIQLVPLVNMTTDVWSENYLRNISEGLPVHAVLVDSSAEAILIKALRKMIWNCDIDMHDLLTQIWEAKKSNDPTTQIPNKNNQIYQYVHPLAKQMTEAVVQLHNELNKSETDKIAALQARIKELEGANRKEGQATSSQGPAGTKSGTSESSPQKRTAPLPEISPSSKRQKLKASDAFDPTAITNTRPLTKSAPKSGSKTDVDRWINSIKKAIDPAEAEKLTAYIDSVEKAYAAIKPNTPNLKCLAAHWGLPVDMITNNNFGPTSLMRVSACAAYTSAILSA